MAKLMPTMTREFTPLCFFFFGERREEGFSMAANGGERANSFRARSAAEPGLDSPLNEGDSAPEGEQHSAVECVHLRVEEFPQGVRLFAESVSLSVFLVLGFISSPLKFQI